MLSIKYYIRVFAVKMRYYYLVKIKKMDIAPNAFISLGVKLDHVNPHGIHIGEETYIASGTRILTHDYCMKRHASVKIGCQCFIGADALILCGVTIGDNVIVGGGAVVTKNIPSNSMVAGNPAHIIRSDIMTTKFGQLAVKKKGHKGFNS